MYEEDKKSSFQTETGSLKFGSGSLQMINEQECWLVPGMGFYNSLGKYLGETLKQAQDTLEQRAVKSREENK